MTASVLCIGVANVDILASVDTAFLLQHRLDKGTSTLKRREDLLAMIALLKDPMIIPGGCAANTACGVSLLGVDTHYAGMIGNDEYGDIFRLGFEPYGVHYNPLLHPEKPTSLCLTLVTPDKERSFVFSPSAASWDLAEENLPDMQPAIVYTESNLFRMTAGTTEQTLLHAVTAKYCQNKTQVILNLIDTEITRHNRQAIFEMIRRKKIAYMVSNLDELMALFDTDNTEEAFQSARASGQTFITTLGRDGAMVIAESRIDPIAGTGIPLEDIVDTVGAGDQFSAGFIAALARNQSLDEACLDGTRKAAEILSLAGARPKAA